MLLVALDANVLVPIVACDFLLTAFDHGLYEPIVSAAALDEVERALADDFRWLDAAAIGRRVGAMRAALEDHIVVGAVAGVPSTINAKDRHVVSAALEAEAAVVVTNDQRLRPEIDTAAAGLRAVDLDAFAVGLWESSPGGLLSVFNTLVRKRRVRPVTTAEMLAALGKHMPRLVACLPLE
jgi:rRNA-processing protein FCF1